MLRRGLATDCAGPVATGPYRDELCGNAGGARRTLIGHSRIVGSRKRLRPVTWECQFSGVGWSYLEIGWRSATTEMPWESS
jgi:hypothetical protein